MTREDAVDDSDVETVREALTDKSDFFVTEVADSARYLAALDRLVSRLATADQRVAELERVIENIQRGANAGGSM